MQKDKIGEIQKANNTVPAEKTEAAHREADIDIEKDPELHDKPEPGDDLDEGELARFESND